MLNVVMLSVVLLSVVLLNVIILNAVGPGNTKGGSITVPLISCLTSLVFDY
jgi:hypothetical protein